MPGGCVIGARPIDLHLKGMRDLGAKVRVEAGYVYAKAKRLTGGESFLGGRCGPTVLGTANMLMAASLAKGKTLIHSAACEPEIEDLAKFLNAMGAKISGAGSPTITIQGVRRLRGAEHRVIPDRIEAATYALAGAVTDGDVTLRNCHPSHLSAVLHKMREAGVRIETGRNTLRVRPAKQLRSVDITTMPHAGFPTDVQAQMMVLMLKSPGISIITERIFESRFMHVNELARMGADISIEGPSAIIKGGQPLSGADVMASDLRASAALVLAGMAAKGVTRVNRVYHIDRGYENIDGKLRALGANISREPGQ
jgi:UDP-N-acetylglucosamine 1-carboxyvinyltransferase